MTLTFLNWKKVSKLHQCLHKDNTFCHTFELCFAIFPLKVPANCLWMTLAFSFSEDLIVLVLLWRAAGLSWKSYLFLPFISLLNIVNTTVNVNYTAHYRGDFPWTREAKRTLSRCQEVFLSAKLMLTQSWKKAMKKGWDRKGWPLSFLLSLWCERKRVHPGAADNKCMA